MPLPRIPAVVAALAFAFFASVSPVKAFEIQQVESPGGIEAWLVEDHAAPIMSLSFAFRGGSAAEPADKAGLARFVAAMLNEGAGDLDATAYQNRIADLSVDLDIDASRDEFDVTIRMLNDSRDEAIELLRLALIDPRFDADAVERIRSQILTSIARDATDPTSIAFRTYRGAAFPDHAYGRDTDGTVETVAAIGASDLHRFVEQNFARDNLVIGAVGDIDAAALGDVLDRIFGDLPEHAGLPVIGETAPLGGGQTIIVEREIPQSVVVFAGPGVKRDDPDFYVVSVLMEALGGGFGSRLTDEVREKRGLAYSVGAYLATFNHAGVIIGQAGTRNERVAETVQIIRDVLADVASNGLAQDEIDDARDYIVGSFPLRWTSSRATASGLVAIQLAGLPIDYVDRRGELFDAVTPDDIKRVAARLLDPANFLFVIVGQPDGIETDPPAN